MKSISINIDKVRKEVGRKIKIARIERDVQQKELAAAIGLLPSHLGKLESGTLPIRVEHIVAIAEALECSPAHFVVKT
jgi:transcriptional regulator with XRE-family HTH domain